MDEPTLPGVDDDLPPKDHNQPPEELPYDVEKFTLVKVTTGKFIGVSNTWLKTEITSETLAGQLNDQINGLTKLNSRIEATRKAEKEPHLAAGRTVDAAFKELADQVNKALNGLKPKAKAWLDKKANEERERQAEAKRKADALEAEARRAEMDAANGGTIEDQVAAEKAKEVAAEAQKDTKARPVNVQSASGAGRTLAARKRKVVTVEKQTFLYKHFENRPEVAELLLRLATAEANAAGFPEDGKIPGCTIKIETVL